jgi:hypothetical protein
MKKLSLVLALLAVAATSTGALAKPKAPTDEQLSACLGEGKAIPTPFVGLKRGMSPAEAAAVFPGADKVDRFHQATVKAKDCVGATSFKLSYLDNAKTKAPELYNVAIVFDKALTKDDDFYTRISALLVAKYGPIKDDDSTKKRILTWAGAVGLVQFASLGKTYPFELRATPPKQ